jgi:hypothetical protein
VEAIAECKPSPGYASGKRHEDDIGQRKRVRGLRIDAPQDWHELSVPENIVARQASPEIRPDTDAGKPVFQFDDPRAHETTQPGLSHRPDDLARRLKALKG